MKTNIYIFDHFSLISAWNQKCFRQNCRENKNKRFCLIYICFEDRDVYEILWANILQPGRPRMSIRYMRIACCITKATHTVTLRNIYCFSMQLLFQESASILCYTYISVLLLLLSLAPQI